MILWLDGPHGAAENMRRDRLLLAGAEAGAEPVLRLFAFDPAGITLGARQRPERELDLEACARDRVEWAVRPTGGRAIYHAAEWTYSLATPLADPEWGGSAGRAFARASALIAGSLRRLGIPVQAGARAERGRREPPGPGGRPAPPCFATSARHELLLEGRKLVGSAQRRTALALLQQGSVLIGPGHERLVDYLRLDPARRELWRARLAARAGPAGGRVGAADLSAWEAALAAELGGEARRLAGTAGETLLTLVGAPPYTPFAIRPPDRECTSVTLEGEPCV